MINPNNSKSFEVKCSTGGYSVKIESGSFERTLREVAESEAIIVADTFFEPQFAEWGIRATFCIATEKAKTLENCAYIIELLREMGVTRQTHLVAVGGGVIQDIVCFIASVYMRGLKWSYVPTTVLAMVDSCIGGKSSINVGPYKNIVGTFHPPKQILIDPLVASTLPKIEVVSGLIEAIKICYCYGDDTIYGMDVASLIPKSLDAKRAFIETDEFDRSSRLLLNFGHTFGHAIESATDFSVPHGIAVGLGILCAIEFSGVRCGRVTQLETNILRMIAEFPLPKLNSAEIVERLQSDKKHEENFLVLILPDAAGNVVLCKVEKSINTIERLAGAINVVAERLKKVADEYWLVASIGS